MPKSARWLICIRRRVPGTSPLSSTARITTASIFLLDPLGIPAVSPEEVALISFGSGTGGIWTAFHLADEYQKGTPSSSRITGSSTLHGMRLRRDQRDAISATDRVTFRPLVAGRVLPFSLFASLRVSRVQDAQGKDLRFIQESKDDDADFAVIMPQTLEPGKDYTLSIQYAGGGAIQDTGGGNLYPASPFHLVSEQCRNPVRRPCDF